MTFNWTCICYAVFRSYTLLYYLPNGFSLAWAILCLVAGFPQVGMTARTWFASSNWPQIFAWQRFRYIWVFCLCSRIIFDVLMNWCLADMGKRREHQPRWPSAGEVTMPHSGPPGKRQTPPAWGSSPLVLLQFHPFQDGRYRRAPAWAEPGSVVFHLTPRSVQICESNFWFPRRSICDS